jgi:signal transduction histidine kinase
MTDAVANALDPVRILLVDDNPSRLLSYRAILDPLGETLVEASSGMEALRRVMSEDFAVILLDVNMPEMDGFETASLIHQHPRFEKTPIIFVSAVNVSDLDRLRGYKLGAVDYVMVPIIPEILRSKVMVLAELFRKRSELQSLNARLADANRDLALANEALHEDRAREVHQLNESLRATNAELERANRELQGEIVERKRVEDRLREADRRKDEFLATLAHELRNPLAPIQSALNVRRLARPDPGPAERELQSLLERQMRHLVRLVDDLLDVSRITRDRLELRSEVLTIAPVLEAAIETVQPLLDTAGQSIDLSVPPMPVFLTGDPQRLAQVFANLLSNASKFSAQGARIQVAAEVEGDVVNVRVLDAGIGLDASQQAFIFDLFAQVDTSLERARGGLGIGLTLARRLVELHGGRLSASSAGLGLGSEFTVRLPLHLPVEPAAAPTAARDFQPMPRGLRVMVVDDNQDSADMLSLSLKMMGHEVQALYDPLLVADAALRFLPDLVFLDVGMPVLNGFALAERLRKLDWPGGRRPRLVALTGWGQAEDRKRSEQAGFDQHLVKPADLDTIDRVCRQVLEDQAAGAVER